MVDIGTNVYSREVDGTGACPQTGCVEDHRSAPLDHGVYADILKQVVPSVADSFHVITVEDHGNTNIKIKDRWRQGSILHRVEAWVYGDHRYLIHEKRQVSDGGSTGRPWTEKHKTHILDKTTVVTYL